jgi:hypothetical protein
MEALLFCVIRHEQIFLRSQTAPGKDSLRLGQFASVNILPWSATANHIHEETDNCQYQEDD